LSACCCCYFVNFSNVTSPISRLALRPRAANFATSTIDIALNFRYDPHLLPTAYPSSAAATNAIAYSRLIAGRNGFHHVAIYQPPISRDDADDS
jgi:hypothetical protein